MKPNNALLVPALATILGLHALACGPSSEFSVAPDASPAAEADGGAPSFDAAPDARDVNAPPLEGGSCPAGYADCDRDPRNGCEAKLDDPKTCGACGHDCTGLAHVATAVGVTCSAGACAVAPSACATGFAHCSSKGDDGCEADLGKPDHCGACATSCSGPTPVCSGGACSNGCSGATPTSCSGSCVDTKTSASNCGSCGNACPLPAHGQATCAASSCAFTCNGGYHACGSSCADNTSVASCGASCTPCASPSGAGHAVCGGNGACGMACDAGNHLCGSTCASDASVASCGASCTPCAAPSGAGHATCGSNGTCGMACDPGHHLCGTTCVDDSSALTCGTSCTPCASPASNGHAVCNGSSTCGIACDGGYHACGNACSSNNAVASCGASCTPCATPPNAVATCSGVACGFTCNAGYADCDGNAANGCEAKLDSDGNNCSTCGHSCLGGACAGSACQPVLVTNVPGGAKFLEIDDANIYFTFPGGVVAFAKTGGARWQYPLSAPFVALAQDATSVYGRDNAGDVWKIAKNGAGPLVVLAHQVSQLPGATSLVAGGGNVYWSDEYEKQIYYVNANGGPNYAGYGLPTSGGLIRNLVGDAAGLFWLEAASAGRVMWSDYPLTNNGPLPLPVHQYYSQALTLDAARLYWGNQDGTFWSMNRNGTALTQIAGQPYAPINIAVDSQFLYWTTNAGDIRRTLTSGGTVTTVASGGTPYGIAVDAKAIYWSDTSGTLMKLAK